MKAKYATEILKRLREKGYETYFVGGCVRDMVIGIEPVDYDIATGAQPQEVVEIFPRTEPIGVKFGVILVIHHGFGFQVATFRSDQAYIDGRRPTGVVFTSSIEDVRRRDFTINGLLYDPIDERVIDHVGGEGDIQRRIVRAIGDPRERFDEDKLRMLRAIRFSARLDFAIEEETWETVVAMASGIHQISPERTREELARILCEGQAARGFHMLEQSGLLGVILPELEWTGYLQRCLERIGPAAHPDFAVGVLLHCIGIKAAEAVTNRLRFSNAEIAHIISLIREKDRFSKIRQMTRVSLKRFLRQNRFENHLKLNEITALAADAGLEDNEFAQAKLQEWSSADLWPKPLISGEDLIAFGLRPGPSFKEILYAVEDEQLQDRITNRERALDFVRDRWVLSKPSKDTAESPG